MLYGRWHPDRKGMHGGDHGGDDHDDDNDDATSLHAALEAYKVLKDPSARLRYDLAEMDGVPTDDLVTFLTHVCVRGTRKIPWASFEE